jgi:hypothetical protein
MSPSAVRVMDRDDCYFTEAVEYATGEIPGPAKYGCEPSGPAKPVTIRGAKVYEKVGGGNVVKPPKVFTACSEHARHLRAYGYVMD